MHQRWTRAAAPALTIALVLAACGEDDGDDATRAAVWDFLTFLATPEAQATLHIGTGYIPTSKEASTQPQVRQLGARRPGVKVADDRLAASADPPGGRFPIIGSSVGLRDAIEAGVEAMLNGTPATQAQQQAEVAATAAIESYNESIGA